MNVKIDNVENGEHNYLFICGRVDVCFLEMRKMGKGFDISRKHIHRWKAAEKRPETSVETTVGGEIESFDRCEV